LNNPLAAVIGQATLLAEDLQHTDHSDRINKIRRAADRCARIVQSFLAMARQKAPEYRSVDVNDQIRAAVELTEYQMRAANVHIELRLSSRLPMIEADSDQLHQVVVNLLTNARQAMEDTSDDRRITISTERVQQSIRITVADTGKGIPPEVRDRIFDPFFTTKDAGSGTGIGLSYSLGIIEAHRGTLRLEESPVGTVFAIILPVSDAAEPADTPKAEAPRRIKGHVLVIDDEVDVADTLADMLRRTGLEVTVVVGGRAGQAVLASGVAFDIVLSDIRMPDYDGPTLYAWLLANRPELAGRIAFVTGDTLSGLAADFIAASGCRVLEKPFTPAGLRDLIRRMLDA
jgi:CheY-like chemotaxis protein